MAPILWMCLVSSLITHDSDSFDILVDPKSNIMANMKILMLQRLGNAIYLESSQQRRLTRLLTALPRDSLKTFFSNVKLDRSMLRLIIQIQRKLEC